MKRRWIGMLIILGLLIVANANAERLTVQLMVKQVIEPMSNFAAHLATPETSNAGFSEDTKSQANAGIVYEKGHKVEFPIVATIERDETGKITSFRSECIAPQRFFPGTPTTDGPPVVYYHEIYIRTPEDEYMRVEEVDSGRLLRHAHFINVKEGEFGWPAWLTSWVVDANNAVKYVNDIKNNKIQTTDGGSHWKAITKGLELEIDKNYKWIQTNEGKRYEFFSEYNLPSVNLKDTEISYEFEVRSVQNYTGEDDPFLIPDHTDIRIIDASK